jgi:hypothetical protein
VRVNARVRADAGHFALLWAGAGVAWIVSAFVSATSSGLGSTLSAHQLADLVQSGSVSYWVPSWLGVVWYAVPISGAVLIMCSSVDGPVARTTRVITSCAATAVSLALALTVTRWSPSRFGPATWLSLVAALIASTAFVISGRSSVDASKTTP